MQAPGFRDFPQISMGYPFCRPVLGTRRVWVGETSTSVFQCPFLAPPEQVGVFFPINLFFS